MISIFELKNLELIEREISETEKLLIVKYPKIFINFLNFNHEDIPDIILYWTKIVETKISLNDKEFFDLVNTHIDLSLEAFESANDHIHSINSLSGSLIATFLNSLYIAQQLRFIIEMPVLSQFGLKKFLSKSERKLFNLDEKFKFDLMPIINLELNNLLKINAAGWFDLESTLETEYKTLDLHIFFSILKPQIALGDRIIEIFRTNSKHIPFAVLNQDLTTDLAYEAAHSCCEIYARLVYNQIAKRVPLPVAQDEIRHEFQKIAVEYLNDGNSKNDRINLGKIIFQNILNKINQLSDFNEDLKLSVAREILRITLNTIIEWRLMPDSFFSFDFRIATDIERAEGIEVTHAIDIFMINNKNEISKIIYETYLIMYDENLRNEINLLASFGIENPKNLKNFIERKREPNFFKRWNSKIVNFLTMSS